MLYKHISITKTKIIIAVIMVVVMVGIVASKGYNASVVKPVADESSSLEAQSMAPTANSNLVGSSALLKQLSSKSMSVDTTPNHSIVRGSAKSSIQYTKDVIDGGDTPELPYLTPKEVETEAIQDGFIYSAEIPMTKELQEFTYKRCEEMNLDYPIILSLMWRESRFNIHAVGYNSNGTTDSGIMQINDVNRGWLFNELGITNLMDPYENITAGTELLGRLTRDHGQHQGLLAYQYGEQGMKNRVAAGVTTSSLTEMLYTKSVDFHGMLSRAA